MKLINMEMKDFIEDTSIEDSCKMKFTYTSKESHKDIAADKVPNWEMQIGMEFYKLLDNYEDAMKQIKNCLPKFEAGDSKKNNLMIELFNGEISKKIIRKAIIERCKEV